MQVRDLMNPSVVSITPSGSASLAARLLSRHNVGSLPVCGEDGGLRGIVTDRDIILRCVAAEEDPLKTQVKDIMTAGRKPVHELSLSDLDFELPPANYDIIETKVPEPTPRKMVFFEASDEDVERFIEQVHTYLTTEGA